MAAGSGAVVPIWSEKTACILAPRLPVGDVYDHGPMEERATPANRSKATVADRITNLSLLILLHSRIRTALQSRIA